MRIFSPGFSNIIISFFFFAWFSLPLFCSAQNLPGLSEIDSLTTFQFKASNSGKCLDVPGNSTSSGVALDQWDCLGGYPTGQAWRFIPTNSGSNPLPHNWILIMRSNTNSQSGGYIAVENTSNGAAVLQKNTAVDDTYLWKTVTFPDGRRQFINKASGRCLTVEGSSQSIGAPLTSRSCVAGGQANQLWYIESRVGFRQMRAVHSGKCVDIEAASQANGAYALQWDCLGINALNQQWTFIPQYDYVRNWGGFQIVSRNSGKCLQIENGTLANGARLQQSACFDALDSQSNKQIWHWVKVGIQSSTGKDIYGIFSYTSSPYQSKYMNISGASVANGAQVLIWDFYGIQQTESTFTLSAP